MVSHVEPPTDRPGGLSHTYLGVCMKWCTKASCLSVCGLIAFHAIGEAQQASTARIAAAQERARAAPESADAYLDLALKHCRRGRDVADSAPYDEANAAIDRALAVAPGNWDALKLHVVVLLGRHAFGEALKQARELNRKTPDDITVWGYLVDANMALGEYAEAEKDAQWILDLRRGSTLGFVKAAALREVFGDLEGALEFYHEALLRTSPNDPDERAWLMTQDARLQLASGNTKRAGELLEGALTLHPGSQLAAGILAALKASQGSYSEALALRRQMLEKTPNAKNLYALANMLEKSGRPTEADAAFRDFESRAQGERAKTFNANRELVFYYADRLRAPERALAIAAKEAETRHDSETLDAYAWALYRSGKFAEARTQIDRALAPGVRDGGYFCHAVQIAAANHDAVSAQRFEKELSGFPASACPAVGEVPK